MNGRERGALTALYGILAVTLVWWALALWPLPSDSPYWLVRTREFCFGAAPDGLPTRAGWILLVGEPLGMLALALALWRDAAVSALDRGWHTVAGRAALLATGALIAGAAGAASFRVKAALARELPAGRYVPPPSADYPRLDHPAPPLALVDQHGDSVSLAQFRGRTVLVAFAYAHCATVCPQTVQDALAARRRLDTAPALLIVTVDPWRDTPARLPAMASAWNVGRDAQVLSGDTMTVTRTLDAWNVPHARDAATGDVAHPNLVYIVDAAGRIAYAAVGQVDAIVALAGRL